MKLRINFAVLFVLISFFLTHANAEFRIVNGRDIKIKRSPHSVAILQVGYRGNVLRCTGSLVSKDTVLTAGYCGVQSEGATVAAGVTNLCEIERERGQTSKVQNIYFYDNNPETKYLSLAVLKLDSPFTDNDKVKSILLCEAPLEPLSMMEIRGWGSFDAIRDPSAHLQAKTVKVKDTQECRNVFANKRVSLPDTVICGGKDLGTGDLGAGGVRSSRLCAVAQLRDKASNVPDLYTNVGIRSVRDFIISKM